MVKLHGNTFPARVALYNLGATYDKAAKVWHCREDIAPKAQAIVDILTPVKQVPAANADTVLVPHAKGCGQAMKDLGARWDGAAKAWQVPAGKAGEARALVGAPEAPEAPKTAPKGKGKAPKGKAKGGTAATV